MHMTISVAIMQVTVSVVAMYVIASSSNFIFLSVTDTHFSENWRENIKFAFHHFYILPKLRYFVGKYYIQIG